MARAEIKLALWIILALVLYAGVGWVFWRGGKESRREVKELTEQAKETARSNQISRGTQERIGIEGYETRKHAQADDRELRKGADPGATAADDGGMRVAQAAYESALRAACRVRRAGACDGAAGAREHD